jgi:hypothetical protein
LAESLLQAENITLSRRSRNACCLPYDTADEGSAASRPGLAHEIEGILRGESSGFRIFALAMKVRLDALGLRQAARMYARPNARPTLSGEAREVSGTMEHLKPIPTLNWSGSPD